MPAVDLVERNHFRTDSNGKTVFFPWSLTGRGYIVADEATKAHLLRVLRAVYLAALALAMVTFAISSADMEITEISFSRFAWLLGLALLPALGCIAVYGLWVTRFIERLQPSDMQLTRAALLAEAAREMKPAEHWKALAACVVIIAVSLVAAFVEPDLWWLAAVAIVLLGSLSALSIWMLRTRRQQRRAERDNPSMT